MRDQVMMLMGGLCVLAGSAIDLWAGLAVAVLAGLLQLVLAKEAA